MEESTSTGTLVPAAKAVPTKPTANGAAAEQETDDDYMCTICMQETDDDYKSDCPTCGHRPLHNNCLFPNFLLNKVGSADSHIHYYDLRSTSQPLHMFSGHKKAVLYVKFLSNNELASASTDSTLRLCNVKEKLNIRTFTSHVNEKNFVGLTANHDYISCGSETNEVFVYHKAISRPATWHRFGSPEVDDFNDNAGSCFISAVC